VFVKPSRLRTDVTTSDRLYHKISMGSGSSRELAYDPKKDRCVGLLEAYVACVEGKNRGLKEGDECLAEGAAYKACRKQEKEALLVQARDLAGLQTDIQNKMQATEDAAKAVEAVMERKARALKNDILSRKD